MHSPVDAPPSLPRLGGARLRDRAPLWLLVAGVAAQVAYLVLVAVGLAAGALSLEDAAGALLFIAGSFVSLAAVLAVRRRQPDHPLAGTFVALVATNMLHGWLDVVTVVAETTLLLPWPALGHTLAGAVVAAVTGVLFATVLALYPDGRTRRRVEEWFVRLRWWWLLSPMVLLVSGAVPVPWYAGELAPPDNPLLIGPGVGLATANTIRGVLQITIVALAVLLLATRYHHLDLEDRRRTRWLALPVIVLSFGIVSSMVFQEAAATFVFIIFVAVPPMIDVAIALGILRRPDATVDRVVRRTLVYLALWTGIAGMYAGAGAVVGLTAGNRLPIEWAVGLTILAMLAFNPVRLRLQALADRYVFGQRADPSRLIGRLGDSLETGLDLDTVLPRMALAIEEGLGLEWARVRLTSHSEADDATGGSPTPALAVPIQHRGEVVGVVECGPGHQRPLGVDDVAIIETLARQAGLAVGNVRLAQELRDRADKLATSRTRLVRAQERERRRIERNIHDGVQQDLVGLMALVGSMRQRANGTVPSTELDDVADGLVRVHQDLRALAAGIHPSVLTDHGLLVAVEALAQRCPVPVQVRADQDLRARRFNDEVEGVAYFTVAEAVANSAKHARASRIRVSLVEAEDVLAITVADDGIGIGPGHGDGQGLANMEERVDAVDGTFGLQSTPGSGTELHLTIPVGWADQ